MLKVTTYVTDAHLLTTCFADKSQRGERFSLRIQSLLYYIMKFRFITQETSHPIE